MKYLYNLRKFEEIAIKIVDLFDRKEEDNLNDNLLLSEIQNFGCHVLKLAFNGHCKKFIATRSVQQVLHEIWKNGVIFSPDQILVYDYTRFRSLELFLSYLTVGLIAPFFQTFDWNLLAKEKKYSLSRQKSQSDFEAVDNRNDERLISAYRLVKTEILRYPTENELKSNSWQQFCIKYRNFMYSPRSHFVYETIFYLIFLLLFSYYMLCKFKFEWHCDSIAISQSNFTMNRTKDICINRVVEKPIWIDYLLVAWVFSLMCHELNQVIFLKGCFGF